MNQENKGLLQRKAYDSNYLENIPNKTPEDYQQITKLQKEMKDLKKQINKERKEYAKYIEQNTKNSLVNSSYKHLLWLNTKRHLIV